MRIRPRILVLAFIPALLVSCQSETEPAAEAEPASEVAANTESDATTSRSAETDEFRPSWPWPVDSVPGGLDMEQVASQAKSVLSSVFGALDGDPIAAPVPTETLKELFPASIGRFEHTGYEPVSETIPMVGITALYESDDERIKVTIFDMALVVGAFGVKMPFTNRDVSPMDFRARRFESAEDKEYPYFERLVEEDDMQGCAVIIWVEERFMVVAGGIGVPMAVCHLAREALPLRELQQLAQEYAPVEVGN